MNLPSSLTQYYLISALLLVIAAALVGRFPLSAKTKVLVSRLLLLVCLTGPLAVRFIEPPSTALSLSFVSLDGLEQGGESSNKVSLNKGTDEKNQRSIPYPNAKDLEILLVTAILVGAGLRFALLLRDFHRLRRLVSVALPFRSFGALSVVVSGECQIPFSVRTLRRALVVVPLSLLGDSKNLKLAIAHEGQHHRHGDCLFAYVVELVGIFFFWNPAVWRWRRIHSELQEFSCDEALVGHRAVSAHDYGRCLLKVAQAVLERSETSRRNLACTVGMSSGRASHEQSLLRRRIVMFSQYEPDKRSRVLLKSFVVSLSIAAPLCVAYAARGVLDTASSLKIDTSALDEQIQRIASVEIEQAVKTLHAKSGVIAIADAKTGRVVAFAEKLSESGEESWATKKFVPGSTIKPFIAAAALESHVATEDKKYDCRQPYVVAGNKFVNWGKNSADFTVKEAVAKSLNVCVIKIAQEVGADRLQSRLSEFGFDTSSKVTKTQDDNLRLAQTALGVSAPVVDVGTMMRAYSILANDGRQDSEKVVVSPSTAESVRRMMQEAVTQGTAKNAALPGLQVAGKTGTLDGNRDASSLAIFAGMVPSKGSHLVTFVVIENGYKMNGRQKQTAGGEIAAPVFRDVMQKTLAMQR